MGEYHTRNFLCHSLSRILCAAYENILTAFCKCKKNLVRLLYYKACVILTFYIHQIKQDINLRGLISIHDYTSIAHTADRIFPGTRDIQVSIIEISSVTVYVSACTHEVNDSHVISIIRP